MCSCLCFCILSWQIEYKVEIEKLFEYQLKMNDYLVMRMKKKKIMIKFNKQTENEKDKRGNKETRKQGEEIIYAMDP